MLCENCKKNNATTYFKQTVNGKTREVFLCSECASKLGFGDSLMNMGNFGLGLGTVSELFGSALSASARCPGCGISFNEVSKNGIMGCADCYDAFRDYLRRLLPRISGNKSHVGKVPHSTGEQTKEDLSSLKAKLQDAIRTENFEEATVLRDKIRALENQKNKENDETNHTKE